MTTQAFKTLKKLWFRLSWNSKTLFYIRKINTQFVWTVWVKRFRIETFHKSFSYLCAQKFFWKNCSKRARDRALCSPSGFVKLSKINHLLPSKHSTLLANLFKPPDVLPPRTIIPPFYWDQQNFQSKIILTFLTESIY